VEICAQYSALLVQPFMPKELDTMAAKPHDNRSKRGNENLFLFPSEQDYIQYVFLWQGLIQLLTIP
jgi:hypothetical protein